MSDHVLDKAFSSSEEEVIALMRKLQYISWDDYQTVKSYTWLFATAMLKKHGAFQDENVIRFNNIKRDY